MPAEPNSSSLDGQAGERQSQGSPGSPELQSGTATELKYPHALQGETASRPAGYDALLAEAGGAVRWQMGEGVGGLAAVAVLDVDVRPGGVTGRFLVADQLALAHAVAGPYLEAQQVAVEREEVVAVSHDDVVAIADQLAVEQAGVGRHHDAVIGGKDGRPLLVRDVDAGMEVGVAEAGRFERLSAGAEDERDAALLQWPNERVFRRVVRAGVGQREEVVLHPELCLLPGGLLGLGDQLVLAGDFHVGDPLRERRGLAIDGHQLPLHL